MLHLWSSSKYAIELPDGHRFPMSKYQLVREGVLVSPQAHQLDDLLDAARCDFGDGDWHGSSSFPVIQWVAAAAVASAAMPFFFL